MPPVMSRSVRHPVSAQRASTFAVGSPLTARAQRPTTKAPPRSAILTKAAEQNEVDQFNDGRDVTKPLSMDDLRGLIRNKGNSYSEEVRKFRRTVYMHDEWVKHRGSTRFADNMLSIGKSGISNALSAELTFVTGTAFFVVLMNILTGGYEDLDGIKHAGALASVWHYGAWSIPAQPFGIAMPALSLLLVFRTNTAYSRWNEARTLWGGVVNNCRNIVRQANTFYPNTPDGLLLRDQLAGNTQLFCKALRNFLRGPTDDATFRLECYEMVGKQMVTSTQVEACMAAKNRPMFCLSAMSANLRRANIDPIASARIDTSISVLVDLTGACERIFKSPIPLVYTRHTARFLTAFLMLLPFGLWQSCGGYWNHWVTVPATDVIAFFLFGIEEIGIQIEEPFSILPLEALCDGAIAATVDEMVAANNNNVFLEEDSPTKVLENA